ncbi:MAG TPA: methyltransferase domain-containing protein, partial [Thermomicrobiales bacterium]|nr:methyltransferase domain-containing protein [Thermomicrobiales bacterium]
ADDIFDAVWFANTSQYLTDEELNATLAELQRVVRPGGLVALKESDTSMIRVHPGPPGLILRWFDAVAAAGIGHWGNGPRGPSLPGRVRRSGLTDVWQRTTLIERSAPFDPVVRATWWGLFRYLTALAPELDVPAADQKFLAGISDREAFERFLDNPDCWLIEGNILTVGAVSRETPIPA